MKQLMDHAVSVLNAGGIAAGRVYPNVWQPVGTGVMATVGIGKMDDTSKQVQILVVTTSSVGAAACEDGALKVCGLLKSLGQVRIDGPCKYDGKSDLFTMELTLSVGSME